MNCPKCEGTEAVKAGTAHEIQRYKCKNCGCHYTKSSKRGYPNSIKLKAINLYLEDCGFRRIEKRAFRT